VSEIENAKLHAARDEPDLILATDNFLDSLISRHGGEVSSVDRISIGQHISRGLVPGKRFPHLLYGPCLRGMFRHSEVHHPASLVR
jgi:hypothetical protein